MLPIRRVVILSHLSQNSNRTISYINTTLHHYIVFVSFQALNGDHAFSKSLVKRALGHWNHPRFLWIQPNTQFNPHRFLPSRRENFVYCLGMATFDDLTNLSHTRHRASSI